MPHRGNSTVAGGRKKSPRLRGTLHSQPRRQVGVSFNVQRWNGTRVPQFYLNEADHDPPLESAYGIEKPRRPLLGFSPVQIGAVTRLNGWRFNARTLALTISEKLLATVDEVIELRKIGRPPAVSARRTTTYCPGSAAGKD
jgi:hypothetical protein